MDCNGTVNERLCTRRLIDALKFHRQKDVNRNRFISYFKEEYTQLMNDWTHLMSKHSDIDPDKYDLDPCDLSDCNFALRHHRARTNNKQPDIDEECMFYEDKMDEVHCYFYHRYDFGPRVKRTEGGTIDIAQVTDTIRLQQERIANIEGLNHSERYKSNKFSMDLQPEEQGTMPHLYFTLSYIYIYIYIYTLLLANILSIRNDISRRIISTFTTIR